jgi:serine protease Do
LHLPQDWGVVVADVTPDGPADKNGMQPGDIVLSINGRNMEDARQMEITLYRLPVGDKANLKVLRGNRRLTMEMPVVAEDDDPQRFADIVDPEKNLIPKLGILGVEIDRRVAPMLPELRKEYGVIVAARAAGAAEQGIDLQPGDVIYALNNQPTASVAALTAVLGQLKSGDAGVLQVEREGHLKYIAFEAE